jgi:FtsH-binding integral membrane protein
MADIDIMRGAAIPADAAASERISAFLRAAYGWMCAGLAITATTAWFVASSPILMRTIVRSGPLYLALVIAQLGIVFFLSARVQRLSASTASWLFIGYSMLTGVTLSIMMLVYTGETLTSTFVIAAGMFGAMAAYGTVARRSLAGWGQFLFMGLIGVVLASVVGLFWHNDGLQFVISFIGVIVFTGLAAYDAQRLKSMALMTSAGETGSYAIVGALALYLDFVNLFLMLLRLQGGGRRR